MVAITRQVHVWLYMGMCVCACLFPYVVMDAMGGLLCCQELVEIVGRSTGIAVMAPPTDSAAAQKTLDTLLSAVNKKQKVHCTARNLLYTLRATTTLSTLLCKTEVPVYAHGAQSASVRG